jgi:hypothetical protein
MNLSRANARQDGRAEAYDIAPNEVMGCVECIRREHKQGYPRGQVFLVGAVDSPYRDGTAHYFCLYHLPDNVVIVDPHNGFECRNKHGSKRWRES